MRQGEKRDHEFGKSGYNETRKRVVLGMCVELGYIQD